MTLTKENLTKTLCRNVGYSRAESTTLIESLLEIIKKTLENGEDVLVSGFGKFCVKEKRKRRGRNPVTGDDTTLRARRIITFRCSSVLREKINHNKQQGK
jgi:integration host factor subunit alpha